MEFQAVSSSNINGLHYDSETSTLTVEFRGGSRYKYSNVPEADYEAFLHAASPGKYFHDYIKDQYPTQKV